MAEQDAARARALVGVPFRPQGRDPALGLDCIGLTLAAYGLPVDLVRADYRLRGNYRAKVIHQLLRHFREVTRKQSRPGDLLFMLVAEDQMHFGVLTDLGFVHADASIRKVVETPGEPTWPLAGIFRRRVRRRLEK